ncbi:3-oxoadipate enol-lactonase [Seinonella peptonophila]|uniref:3-oxoadipate enol-lactonase n=1 Tax=Seinonella peptonophila TaxID=112248 RepID=A0A1M4U2A1_9BACL|nr:alpha/beta fold hydrolase [Seinonella peptonophila]SHE50825.1 3-oxoadipate enol-lactonase [Seinonella peptonophila]
MMPTFLSNGATLYYEEIGQGEPLLLLHGLTMDHHAFDSRVEELKHHFRTIVLDARGHGKSSKLPHYTIEDHIHDVIALMNLLKIDSASVLGESMGSYIAQGVATQCPKRIKKLILVVSKAHGKTSSLQELTNRHTEELEGLTFDEKFAYITKYMFYNVPLAQKIIREINAVATVLTPAQQNAANRALEGFDFREDLPKVTAPTLIISGKYDGMNPPERGQEIASLIPNATFIEFEQSGHMPSGEQPKLFLDTVLDFLNK